MSRSRIFLFCSLLGAWVWLFSFPTAHAHPGHYHPPEDVDEFESEAFLEGIKHPLTGWDHLLAAFGVGGLAVAMGKPKGLTTAGMFFTSLGFGYAFGQAGYGFPMLEAGLAVAVLAVGVLLMLPLPNQSWLQWVIVGLIGLWNGGAHGAETANTIYGIGLLTGMIMISLSGSLLVAVMILFQRRVPQWSGVALAAVGLIMMISRM